MSYVIAAYTVLIGSLVLHGLWLQVGRHDVAKQEAGLLARRDRASGTTPSADSEATAEPAMPPLRSTPSHPFL